MRLILNKRFSRIILLAAATVLVLSLAGVWSRRPRLDSNGFENNGLLPLLGLSGKTPEAYNFETASAFFPVSMDIEKATNKEICASFPSYMTQRIQPVLKMGHGESRAKINGQLDSVSACFTNDELLIFSDLAEKIGDQEVIDILADLPEAFHIDNPDFEGYIAMQEMKRNGTLDNDKEAMSRINGWKVDKYKFIPMIERAWTMRPGRDWYVFYETDTYIVWDNMFRFLSTLDPAAPLYMGSPSPGQHDEKKKFKTWFANGGPGFVLSRAAMERLLHRESSLTGQLIDPPLNLKWRDLLRGDCCGDSVLGWALWNVSVPLSGFFPMFNVYPLHGIPFTERFWCQPVLTMHKTTPEDMVKLWKWEHSRRKRGEPLLYSGLYEFQHPGEPAVVSDWDNGDLDQFRPPPEAKVDSFDTCGQACRDSTDCFQWLWRGQDVKECVLMRSIRKGIPRKMEVLEQPQAATKDAEAKPGRKIDYKSGWVMSRIEQWKNDNACKAPQWLGPSITRVY
ncbi:glycosyltransferase family 31 protein [Thozetella sp. PMI_491]|nr:glycosyltransferase family 31 protein [Thozetella sp. PMI_491]